MYSKRRKISKATTKREKVEELNYTGWTVSYFLDVVKSARPLLGSDFGIHRRQPTSCESYTREFVRPEIN